MTGKNGQVVKGPKWVEPEFVKMEKYFRIRGNSNIQITRK